jgi:large subunit ribosomal protein L17
MRHRRGGTKLGRLSAHRWALFRNLLTALFRHERITTTEAKAKALRPLADHLVTLGKRDDLHARRQALGLVPDAVVVRKLFDAIAARYADRRGGYTRIIPAGTRRGDAAPLVILELVDRPVEPKAATAKGKKAAEPKGKEAKKARKAAAGGAAV